MNPKYSLIIPTYNHCEDYLKPAVESILKYTDHSQIEIIIVANGCTDGTYEYFEFIKNHYPVGLFKLLWYADPIGYTAATNKGIYASSGEFVIFLNNDIEFIWQGNNEWINRLMSMWNSVPNPGVVGALMQTNHMINRKFVLFFCAMTTRKIINEIGMLDEIFSPGAGEDTDFCIKVENAGYAIIGNESAGIVNGVHSIDFPLNHKGGGTCHDTDLVRNWEQVITKNDKILMERYGNIPKYSVIIPTYNHCDDLLRPCLESIIKYTDFADVEVIVVANGCTDNTKEYVESLGGNFRLVWSDAPLGYTRATNKGILESKGEYVIFLNNDTELLEQQKNEWIGRLMEYWNSVDRPGVVGPLKDFNPVIGRHFITFFLAMTTRKIIDEIGLLDEIFSPGAGEDTDFCVKAEDAGYAIVGDSDTPVHGNYHVGTFPILHKAEGTVHDKTLVKNWDVTFKRNSDILAKRYGVKKVSSAEVPKCDLNFDDVTTRLSLPVYRQISICDPVSVGRGKTDDDKLRGYSTHRLKRDDPYHADEVALSDRFAAMDKDSPAILEQIVFGDVYGAKLDWHERRLMATMIQWLGTPVGKNFLREAGILTEKK
jgi:GT2 family glycosyltransferase